MPNIKIMNGLLLARLFTITNRVPYEKKGYTFPQINAYLMKT
jgi:hypothetical protein